MRKLHLGWVFATIVISIGATGTALRAGVPGLPRGGAAFFPLVNVSFDARSGAVAISRGSVNR